MTTKLRHRIDSDGVLLIIEKGGRPEPVRVTEQEALKAAWAILADLDPDEVDEIELAKGERRRQLIRSRMIRLLAISPCTIHQMAQVLGISGSDLSGYLLPMRQTRLVERINPINGREPAVFGLTFAGQQLALKEGIQRIARRSSYEPDLSGDLFGPLSSKPKRRRRKAA